MKSLRQKRLELAAAERDLLVTAINGLLGETGIAEPDHSLTVDQIVRLTDHIRDRFRNRPLSICRTLPPYRA